jgi:hypothetical protein
MESESQAGKGSRAPSASINRTARDKRLGQVWGYEPRGKGDSVYSSNRRARTCRACPTTSCAGPRRGGGLVIREGHDGVNRPRGLTPRGRVFDLARDPGEGSSQVPEAV